MLANGRNSLSVIRECLGVSIVIGRQAFRIGSTLGQHINTINKLKRKPLSDALCTFIDTFYLRDLTILPNFETTILS